MPANFPRITISIAHNRDGSDATGELNTLSLGLGLFMGWAFTTVFGAQIVFDGSSFFDGLASADALQSSIVAVAHMASCGIALLFIGFTNQMFLKFYVSKWATIAAATLASVGTVLVAFVPLLGIPVAILAGALMGGASSLMFVLWGTCFARYEFTTIILNSIVAVVISMLLYVGLTHWIIPPISGVVTTIVPIVATMLLWKLTPLPYYLRKEIPIFHPLSIRKTAFVLRFGVPAIVLGFSLGSVRRIALTSVLPSDDLTTQLLVGLAACVSVLIIVVTVAASRDESHWDSVFRVVIPIVAAAIFCIPLLDGSLNPLACFVIACGMICFEALVWIFFSDLAQEFRLSPIYVFGIGRGMLACGSLIAYFHFDNPLLTAGPLPAMSTEQSFFLMLILVVGYALLPRKRDIRRLITPISPSKDATDHLRQSVIEHAESAAGKPAAAAESATPELGGEGEGEGEEGVHIKGRFHAKCEEIADRYLLSRRETEVMFLLAKGHNAAFIQDKLCISKSTAKTHINHIYRKLDIHTQQELLNMMEEEPEAPSTPTRHMKPLTKK